MPLQLAAAFCSIDRKMLPAYPDVAEATALLLRNPYLVSEKELRSALGTMEAAWKDMAALVDGHCSDKRPRDARKLLYAAGHWWALRCGLEPRFDPSSTYPPVSDFCLQMAAAFKRCDLGVGTLHSVLAALCRFYKALRKFRGPSAAAQRVRAETWAVCFGVAIHDTQNVLATIRSQNVLLLGETGTGKEIVAQAIMAGAIGPEGDEAPPCGSVNAAMLTEELAASDLFGHERGAFTGAVGRRQGKLLEASGGTFFFDELAELPLVVRAQLLRVLSTSEVTPVGSNKSTPVLIRFVSATRKPLDEMAKRDEFPCDLYERLVGTVIRIPALRDRREDIVSIGLAFAHAHQGNKEATSIGAVREQAIEHWLTEEASRSEWPGNVRELESQIKNQFLGFLGAPAKPSSSKQSEHSSSTARPAEENEGALLDGNRTRALERAKGNYRVAAEALGISEDTLRRWKKSGSKSGRKGG